jgi:cytochrome o ubiquinol oxidase subunit IV
MNHYEAEPDYGMGQKKLSLYLVGLIGCSLLTILAFWAVMSQRFDRLETFIIIYSAACVQFFVQLICFLRLNTETERARMNVMSIVFTGVILTSIIVGSLWIMFNLDYNMMN